MHFKHINEEDQTMIPLDELFFKKSDKNGAFDLNSFLALQEHEHMLNGLLQWKKVHNRNDLTIVAQYDNEFKSELGKLAVKNVDHKI